MGNQTNYKAAELNPQLVNEIKSFEDKLSQQSDKDLVVIAYQKDRDKKTTTQ